MRLLKKKKLLNGLEVEITPTSLKHYLRDWLKLFKQDNVRKTLLSCMNVTSKSILSLLSKHEPKRTQTNDVSKFINSLTDQGYSKRTVQIIHGTMNNAMKKAVSLKN